ncbi:exopolysaccharide Pel transporter PelG [Pectinatus haikarae]|uniref:Membrane protein n=1 Tax=Pectinatus haikarae TaxID=349096 RepID=A0ABT9Y595_9FIRM|nr:exopolysaccharide Pel transporter PelG [Pectinatus haikarae]MDQ0202901.1 putative membrane protein [Pectinatus haikarae]
MAGIGFELKRLFADKSVYGYSKAFSYTIMVTLGPFILMTVMILSIQLMLKIFDKPFYLSELYVVSVIYPFIFSHIFSSGFNMIITRYISDKLYIKKYDDIIPSMYGILSIALFCAAIPGALFFYFAKIDLILKLFTFIFFMQMIMLWLLGVYLSALKDFAKIVRCYGIGITVAIVLNFLALYINFQDTVSMAMICMNAGILLINILLLFEIKKYFTTSSNDYLGFLPYFDNYGSLFTANLSVTLGMYIPNIIFWFSEMQTVVSGTYIYAPSYDTATFFAFMSSLAVMVMFVVVTETNFYTKYARYFNYITNKGNAADIETAKIEMIGTMWRELRNIFEFQLVITLLFIVAGNYLLPLLGLNYEAISIYQVVSTGAYACALMQIIIILLFYFEDRRGAMVLCISFLALNIISNLVSLHMGRTTFGTGFFLTSFIMLPAAVYRLDNYMQNIDYYIFCKRPVYHNRDNGIFTIIYEKLICGKREGVIVEQPQKG